MKVSVKKVVEVDAKYLVVNAGVRYWEDGDVNGTEDISYEEQEKGATPHMPNAVKVGDEYRWVITIDLDNGSILDWPKGVEARVHYKVCDDGIYTLCDENQEVIVEKECYVPKILAFGDRGAYGYGDYIIFSVSPDGVINEWDHNKAPHFINELINTKSFGDEDDE